MNIFALLRVFGQPFLTTEIKSSLDHHLSAAGAAQLSANLEAASAGLKSGDHEAAAAALAAVVLSIH